LSLIDFQLVYIRLGHNLFTSFGFQFLLIQLIGLLPK
jgi:hypothetical protein